MLVGDAEVSDYLSFEEYARKEGISQSALKPILTSTLEFVRALKEPRKDTPALVFGRAVDVAAFTPQEYALQFAVHPSADEHEINRRTKKGKEEWAELLATLHGKTLLSRADHDRAWECGRILGSHPLTRGYFRGDGQVQVPLQWTDPATGVKCKGRLDKVMANPSCIIDGKTAQSVDRHRFGAAIAKFGYHFQGAFYRQGWHAVYGEWLPFKIPAIESKGAHDVGVFIIDGESLAKANELVKTALERYARFLETGEATGRYSGEESAMLPVYALAFEDDDGATNDAPISY